MDLHCRWRILLSLWIVGFVPGLHCKTVNHLSREDVLLLKDEKDPKCFARTEQDFTCFFETADNRIYDLLYTVYREKRCEMSVQKIEVATFLHICSFPESDVLSFVETHLEVVERDTNTSLYRRTVSVEDNFLLDPPFNVSLHQNGQAGQLQVSWRTKVSKHLKDDVMYRIRYSSKGLGVKIKVAKEGDTLDSLVPGEELDVQVAVKYALNPNAGHWSSWSNLVRAVVPQSADDISLMCYTSDLQYITCQWNGSRYGKEKDYKLFYKMDISKDLVWTECLADGGLTEMCRFHGDESRAVRVKLCSSSARLNRTFFPPEFTLRNSIKSSPPCHLRGASEKDKLYLKWETPLQALSAHLQYEVGYQMRGSEAWMTVFVKGPETGACLEVPTGSQYSVKIRAKPNGFIYSGHWSDWSDVLTGETPADAGTLLNLSIPVSLLIMAIIVISLFPTYLRKLKLYFWPPVPNLDKVLQGFLTDLDEQRWNPPITAKLQSSEETTSSVLEIISEDEGSVLGKPSEGCTPLLSERHLCSGGQIEGTGVFSDYVTLNKDSIILCPKGNKYVYEEVGPKDSPGVSDELLSVSLTACSGSDLLNRSYLPLPLSADTPHCKLTDARGPGNLYTNIPCS
ncbi:Thrombopoietin receptor [Dissostichus eleginoides]|uniref:Thrombopoietin receptor n=1 Tax=Dissostichus eleginoides TaxID=100907 RepID=A0AAD9C8P1_DISEL|nr:Thrombopoietin receptor [Dissostichus eleginoides]